jgi:hypothetical protein
MVGYICYRGKEPSVNNELRPGRMSIVKQQGMEVLGVDLSPSVSVKDRSAILCHFECSLTLSWLA